MLILNKQQCPATHVLLLMSSCYSCPPATHVLLLLILLLLMSSCYSCPPATHTTPTHVLLHHDSQHVYEVKRTSRPLKLYSSKKRTLMQATLPLAACLNLHHIQHLQCAFIGCSFTCPHFQSHLLYQSNEMFSNRPIVVRVPMDSGQNRTFC